jgi:hypothetical protein
MRLGDLRGADFGQFSDYVIEDLATFRTMVFRMAEDVDLGAYVLARRQRVENIEGSIVQELFHLLDPETKFPPDALETAVVPLRTVSDLARAPIGHSEEAISLMSRFLNFHLINMLWDAAKLAERDGGKVIKLRHILPACDHWPYPLNRYC